MTWPICCLKLSGVHGHLSYSITLIRSITVMSHEHEGVSNHRHLDSSSNNIFRPTTSETKVPNYWPSVGRHPSQRASDMMTSSNGNIFRVTGHLCGNSPVPGEFPAQRPVTRTLVFSLICVWINDWVNNREAGDLRRYRAHYDVIVMYGECFHVIISPCQIRL